MSWKQMLFYVIIVLMVPAIYLWGVAAVLTGWWPLLVIGAWVLSPGVMALLRLIYEHPFGLKGFLRPRVMSYAFVLGDFVLLPIAAVFAARGWRTIPLDSPGRDMMHLVTSLIAGVIGAGIFTTLDRQRYIHVNVGTALMSPTKVWHDWVVVPVEAAMFVWMLLPQFIDGWNASATISVVFLALFGVAVIYDSLDTPDPREQHPRWDQEKFQVVL